MTTAKEETYIPDIIVDSTSGVTYKKGRFFGKGGFARCYEITDTKTGNIYAGKIIPKRLMKSSNQRDKISQEIQIHSSLSHNNVVGFYGYFEDNYNIYIVLELCRSRSLMELHKRRKALTEPEVRYFLHHLTLGVMYLHQRKVIHRDLKLGNLFLNENLEVKIGDFGLAARLEFDGERKKTVCGTPNYIAPEIINKKGHSYEVDIWSIGCIMYTLLIGKPPFETSSLKETYSRIKRCEYYLPSQAKISKSAAKLIRQMLQPDPKSRPKISEIPLAEFFTDGLLPKQLPTTCLTTAPRFDTVKAVQGRRPLLEVNSAGEAAAISAATKPNSGHKCCSGENPVALEYRRNMRSLIEQLVGVLKTNPGAKPSTVPLDETTDPASHPFVWISKWVDYSDKYGFGYQLSDDSVCVMFNDYTKLSLHPNRKNLYYILENGEEKFYTVDSYPDTLAKKMKLLKYFERYMQDNLIKAGAAVPVRECDSISRLPYMYQWFRTSNGVVMVLSNGTVQVNFIDHNKIILCPLMGAVTFIDDSQNFNTFKFSSLKQYGCSSALAQCLKFAYDKLSSLLAP
ncbi:serine/threonine-protein kinase polo [Schistocerca piceifrons]|uniref:serine/threonine-protein kinase polo n=1 Tax=Schistocerca piceifrons TaxID=274613 RepID=UPI001F5F01F2|nr:serine/threonine-protein kinase polo [Schistocerca piceifrons]